MSNYQVDLSISKPSGLTEKHASIFKDKSVSDSYKHRPPYSAEILTTLNQISPENPRLLDIGCGCGDLTLLLTRISDDVDAVDFSENMIAEAKTRPRSEFANWFVGKVEEQPLSGQYDLITSAQSLHWMDWEVVFPKLKALLKPSGFLAIVNRTYANSNWWSDELTSIINRFSTNNDFTPYRLVPEIETRGFFKVLGTAKSNVEPFEQTIDELVEAFHSRNGLSRDRMADGGVEFGRSMKEVITPYSTDGHLDLGTYSTVTWGKII